MDISGGSVVPVAVTGLGVFCAFGRGTRPLAEAIAAGRPGFAPVSRFDVARRATVHAAAFAQGTPHLAEELVSVIDDACRQSGPRPRDAATVPLLLSLHADPQTAPVAARVAQGVAERCGLSGVTRTYTSACVAGSTSVAHAASLIGSGAAERVVVAAGYLVEPDMFAVFDAGRALTRTGQPRPFSQGRDGLLLGDGVVAAVLEAEPAARRRDAEVLAVVAGWGQSGDAYHVCRPIPDGSGLARAIEDALGRAGVGPGRVGYVNANASGSKMGDAAEAAALRRVFGDGPHRPAVSSTKSVHGHALEASALLEFAVTVLALHEGVLPVNAGYLGPDEDCPLDLVLDGPRHAEPGYALSLNSAFGGANTALLVGAA